MPESQPITPKEAHAVLLALAFIDPLFADDVKRPELWSAREKLAAIHQSRPEATDA